MTLLHYVLLCFFFFNDTATTEIYTLSLHDALPIWRTLKPMVTCGAPLACSGVLGDTRGRMAAMPQVRDPGCSPPPGRELARSEEHTSELQSRQYLVCRLLLEKKKKNKI